MAKAKGEAHDPSREIRLSPREGETHGAAGARIVLGQSHRHALVASTFAQARFNMQTEEKPSTHDYAKFLDAQMDKAATGDLEGVTSMLASQAVTLDTIVTELALRMYDNLGHYPQTAERYGRLALKAQSNCRATLEAIAKLHQPREQTIKHVHVNEGGQAIVAEQFHHHTGGGENGKAIEQCHAHDTALPSPNAIGEAVPIACGEEQASVPHARGN